jgi:hypothetical protein
VFYGKWQAFKAGWDDFEAAYSPQQAMLLAFRYAVAEYDREPVLFDSEWFEFTQAGLLLNPLYTEKDRIRRAYFGAISYSMEKKFHEQGVVCLTAFAQNLFCQGLDEPEVLDRCQRAYPVYRNYPIISFIIAPAVRCAKRTMLV